MSASEGSSVVVSHCVFRNRSRPLGSSQLAHGNGLELSPRLSESDRIPTASEERCFFCSPRRVGANVLTLSTQAVCNWFRYQTVSPGVSRPFLNLLLGPCFAKR